MAPVLFKAERESAGALFSAYFAECSAVNGSSQNNHETYFCPPESLSRFTCPRHRIIIRLSLNESELELVPPTRYPLQAANDLLSRKFTHTGTKQNGTRNSKVV